MDAMLTVRTQRVLPQLSHHQQQLPNAEIDARADQCPNSRATKTTQNGLLQGGSMAIGLHLTPKEDCSVLGWRSKGKQAVWMPACTTTGPNQCISAVHFLTESSLTRLTVWKFFLRRPPQGATHAKLPNLASGQNHPKRQTSVAGKTYYRPWRASTGQVL